MATEQQFEMVSRLLSLPKTRDFFRMELQAQATVMQMCKAVVEGHPLVDVSDLSSMLLREAIERPEQERQIVLQYIKPFPERLPMPWPIALMTASAQGCSALWIVWERQELPGFDTSRYQFFVGGGIATIVDHSVTSAKDFADFAGFAEMRATIVALALASARNASWQHAAPNRAIRRRYPSVAGVRFSHIDIDMGKPKRAGQPRNDDPQHGVPWHHRRGHWAYYRPEAPLFGRPGSHGWYWRPYAEVGDKVHGEVVQDYTVKATLPAGGEGHE